MPVVDGAQEFCKILRIGHDVLAFRFHIAALVVCLATLDVGTAQTAAPASPYGILDARILKPVTGDRATSIRLIAWEEARKAGLPFALVDAVIKIESSYDPSRIGLVGEIGLMQVRPATAALLGFKGAAGDLADPALNIHYGATYLGQAWRLADGDVCRALMKYRAGHNEERMTPLSQLYCERARAHLVEIGSPLATLIKVVTGTSDRGVMATPMHGPTMVSDKPRLGRPLHGAAFWIAEEARVKAATARVRAKWNRIATR